MKNQLYFMRIAIAIWMFQSAFVANAQVCIPTYTLSCSGGGISSFSLKSISNASGCNGLVFNYINYPSSQFTTTLYSGVTYSAGVGFAAVTKSAAVFIDYNNDNDFLDAGELVTQKSTTNALGMSSMPFSLTVPVGTSVGTKRLRVRSLSNSRTWSSADACATLTGAGETEDYTISIANSTITITSGNVSGCRGTLYSLTWTTTGDFNSGNRLFAQFSNASGTFSPSTTTTEINLSATGSASIPIPANLTPGTSHLLRIEATSPSVFSGSKTVTIPTSGCGVLALTTLRIGLSNSLTMCKGTSVSIPFSTVNCPAGTIFKAQISGVNGVTPFVDIPGAITTSSPINALIPFSLPQGDGYKVRIVSSNGLTSNTSSTLIRLTTCLTVSPGSSLCRGIPVNLPVVASGIPGGSPISAELSSSAGVFSNTSPVIIGTLTSGASNPTSINVTIPCTAVNGSAYKIRLIPNNPRTPSEAGASTSSITINTNCTPFLSTATPASLFGVDAFCLGKTYRISAEIFALGCFNADNQFLVDFLDGSDTGPLVASVPVDATNGNYTIPTTMPLGANYFIRLRSTSPAATGTAVGEFPVEDCPEITLQSVCKVGNEYAVFFTSKGTFQPGNQFSVLFSGGGNSVTLGSQGTSSPLMVPVDGSGFPATGKTIQVFSTLGNVSSNIQSADNITVCDFPSITITAMSNTPAPAGTSTAATVCPGGKLRIDFTTTGIFGTGNVFSAFVSGNLDFILNFPETTISSPLIVEIPVGINPPAGPLRVIVRSTIPSQGSNNQGGLTLGTGCPIMTINSVSQSEFCNAPTISVGFVKTGTFNAGNTFSVQLSDANGSFANPIDLVGSKTTTPISVSLPPQFIPNGAGYRLRLKSSDPALVGNSTTANRSKTGPVLNGSTLGPNPVGSVVNLNGTNLTGVNGVVLNNTSATFSVVNSTTINATIPNTTDGNWVVRKNGCVSNPTFQVIGINQRKAVSGEDMAELPTQFRLFPNPTSGLITLQHSGIEAAQISIVNMLGQTVVQDQLNENMVEKDIFLSHLPDGMYIVKYRTEKEVREIRLLKN